MTRLRKKSLAHSAHLKKLFEVAAKNKNVNLNLFIENEDWVAIEGDRTSLEFLGNVLLEFAREKGPDYLIMDSPSPVFKQGSEGIILYRKQ
jgi:hypothetical protein